MNADANTHTETDTRTHWNISSSLALSVRTSARSLHPSHTDVPLGTSAGCGVAAPGAFLGSGGGGGLLRAKQGPRAWMIASFVGHKALSVLGKAMGMGTPPRAGHWAAIWAFCVCVYVRVRHKQWVWVWERESVSSHMTRSKKSVCVHVKACLRRWESSWKDNIRVVHYFSLWGLSSAAPFLKHVFPETYCVLGHIIDR